MTAVAIDTLNKTLGDGKVRVQWPVLMRIAGDAELLAVGSARQLDDSIWRDDTGYFSNSGSADKQSQALLVMELVDSDGRVFKVRESESGSMEYFCTEQSYRLDEVVQFAQQHAAVRGHCCVAKLGAKSIQQVITLVEHLGHE